MKKLGSSHDVKSFVTGVHVFLERIDVKQTNDVCQKWPVVVPGIPSVDRGNRGRDKIK